MSAEPLLLSEARSGVLIPKKGREWWLRFGAILFGIGMVIIGAADVMSRFSEGVLGENAPCIAFGPAITALDPTLAENCKP